MVHFSGTPAEVRKYEFPDQRIGIPLGLAAAILCGMSAGVINGAVITKLKLPPFIVTLGTLGIALGMANILSKGLRPYVPIDITSEIGARKIAGIRLLVIISSTVVVLAAITLRYTRFGRYTFAIGSNSTAARRAGINVDRHLIKVYTLSGLLAGLAGAVDLARFGTANASTHSTDNLNAISAVVIGGTSLFGGMGSIIGTVIGAFIPPRCVMAWLSGRSTRFINRSRWAQFCWPRCISISAGVKPKSACRSIARIGGKLLRCPLSACWGTAAGRQRPPT